MLEQGLKEVLKEYGLEMEQLCGLASIDLKKEEAGLMQLSEKYKIPFVTYNADELMKIRSESESVSEGGKKKENERKRTEIITFCRNDRRADAG